MFRCCLFLVTSSRRSLYIQRSPGRGQGSRVNCGCPNTLRWYYYTEISFCYACNLFIRVQYLVSLYLHWKAVQLKLRFLWSVRLSLAVATVKIPLLQWDTHESDASDETYTFRWTGPSEQNRTENRTCGKTKQFIICFYLQCHSEKGYNRK